MNYVSGGASKGDCFRSCNPHSEEAGDSLSMERSSIPLK